MKSFLRLSVCLAASMFLSGHALAQTLKAGILNVTPLSIENPGGDPSGLFVDLVNEIARRSGVTIDVEIVPIPRIVQGLEAGAYDLTILFPNPQLQAVAEPVAPAMELRTIVLPSKTAAIGDIADLDGKTIAHLRGASYDERVDASDKIMKHEVSDYASGLKMAMAGRVDGMMGVDTIIYYYLNEFGGKREDFGAPYVLNVRTPTVYYSKKTLNSETLEKLKSAIEAYQADKFAEKASEKYMN